MRHGADPDTWSHWDLVLGLTGDLLPIVSNPAAKISPKSDLKAIGKTPSVYNRQRLVIGIKGWSDKITTGDEIDLWSANPDFGLCIQTRRVRGIDIDVPDEAKASAIVEAVQAQLGVVLPKRFRQGSGKCLLAFELIGNFGKRTLQVDGGIVEILMSGQQFVVDGSHFGKEGPSGTRYEWSGGAPDAFPSLDTERFESLCAMLGEHFGTSPWGIVRERIERGEDLDITDDVALWLVDHWPTYGVKGGKLYLRCPWKADHTNDSGETETAWLIAGANGIEQGHFRCLHAHCQRHSDTDFLDAVGYRLDGFDVVEAEAKHHPGEINGKALELPFPGFDRKNGKIDVTLVDVIRACESEEMIRCRLSYDTFRDELMIAPKGEDAWRSFGDFDAVEIRRRLGTVGFKEIGRELIRDAVLHVAERNKFDSAIRWLEGLAPWDAVPRVERFMHTHMGCEQSPYSRAVGLYAWTAHAGRVMEPGCQADMAIVLVSPAQGKLKSSSIAAIAPEREFFTDNLSLEKLDDNLSRMLRKLLVGEMSELRGLNSRESEAIRAWITRRVESWTPKYREHKTIFPRRLVLWATTNERHFLADPAGERRWLPIEVFGNGNVAAIERDRDQLWAEGLFRWREGGVQWREAEDLARDEHAKFKTYDPWEDRIVSWLDDPADTSGVANREKGFPMEAIAFELGLDFTRFSNREEWRIGKILRSLGLDNPKQRVGDRTNRIWKQKL